MQSFGYSDVVELTATPAILGVGQFLYDIYVSGFSTKQAQYDALIATTSLIGTKIATNLLVSKMLGILNNSYATNLSAYLTAPVVNYFLYGYLISEFYTAKNLGVRVVHSSSELMILPVISGLVTQFADKIILTWLTGQKYSVGL